MNRTTPMKRGAGFKPKGFTPRPAKTYEVHTPRVREVAVAVTDTRDRMVVPVPKAQAWRSEEYRRWVSTLPCAHCGHHAPSQAAHSDSGKGMGLKASDDTCYPLCADSPGRRGCHAILGASGTLPREHRRRLEKLYASATRALWDSTGHEATTEGVCDVSTPL